MSAGHEGEEPIDDALLREAAARSLTCVMCGDTDPGAEGISGAVLVSHIAAELLAAREQLRLADALAERLAERERSGPCPECGRNGYLGRDVEHTADCALAAYRATRGAR